MQMHPFVPVHEKKNVLKIRLLPRKLYFSRILNIPSKQMTVIINYIHYCLAKRSFVNSGHLKVIPGGPAKPTAPVGPFSP